VLDHLFGSDMRMNGDLNDLVGASRTEHASACNKHNGKFDTTFISTFFPLCNLCRKIHVFLSFLLFSLSLAVKIRTV
jgi:hypothetical protein